MVSKSHTLSRALKTAPLLQDKGNNKSEGSL